MPFSAPFREPNIAPIFTPGGAVIPWYLLGGVTAAQCVAAYQPKGAADLAASYVNLNNPGTNNAAPGTAPSFAAATGWSFLAASSQFLKTGVTPTSSYTVIVQFSAWVNDTAYVIGQIPSNAFIGIRPSWFGNTTLLWGAASNNIGTGVTNAGNLCIAGNTGYKNGGGAITLSGTFTGTPVQLFIGAATTNGTGATSYGSGNVLAVAIYNITLSSTQVGLIAAAMAAL